MPLIFAIIALLLSFLIGLISGVSFWSIVMRSVILGLITGAFVFGASMLLSHFVPELFSQSTSTQSDDEDAGQAGKNLNISIDDPIDLEAVAMGEDADNSESQNNSADNTAGDMAGATVTEASGDDDFDEDIEELEDLDSSDGGSSSDKNLGATSDGATPDNSENNNAEKAEELSELPDLEEFVPIDEADSAGAEESDFTQVGTGKFDVSADLNSTEVDTNLMAEAVKTVLRRDS